MSCNARGARGREVLAKEGGREREKDIHGQVYKAAAVPHLLRHNRFHLLPELLPQQWRHLLHVNDVIVHIDATQHVALVVPLHDALHGQQRPHSGTAAEPQDALRGGKGRAWGGGVSNSTLHVTR